MTRILILGATGRTGAAILNALPAGVHAIAALRKSADANRLAATAASLAHVVVNLENPASVRRAIEGTQIVVNAIRLRENIAAGELVTLHNRILAANQSMQDAAPKIVTIGGAGALRLPTGQRFWETSAFPQATLPRGRAHAALRDHLEAGKGGDAWTYLIPPPAYDPDGPTLEQWERFAPGADETSFIARTISYTDFGAAVAEIATSDDAGTHLIAWPR